MSEMISFGTCAECGSSGQWVPDENGGQKLRRVESENERVIQDDIAAILRALGIGDHARPISAHQVVHDEILPAISHLRLNMSPPSVSDKARELVRDVVDNAQEWTRLAILSAQQSISSAAWHKIETSRTESEAALFSLIESVERERNHFEDRVATLSDTLEAWKGVARTRETQLRAANAKIAAMQRVVDAANRWAMADSEATLAELLNALLALPQPTEEPE